MRALIGVVAILLASCSGPQTNSGAAANSSPATNAASATTSGGTFTVGNQTLPAYAPIYPLATVGMSTSNSATGGGTVEMTINDTSDAVVAFYKKAAGDAGLTVLNESTTTEVNGGVGHMVMFSGHGDQSLTLDVATDPHSPAVSATIMYGGP